MTTGVRYQNFDSLAMALELGANGALRKPITAEQFSAEISRLALESET